MRSHYYRSTTGDLVFYDTLESVRLNSTGQKIYEAFMAGHEIDLISTDLAVEHGLSREDVQADVAELVKELKSLGIEPATETEAPWHPHTAIVHVIQNCNSPCRMCDCWQTKGKKHHSREQLSKTWTFLASKGNRQVMVSGGEPLLHPELPGIMQDIKAHGMEALLNTNGLLLHRASWLAQAEVSEIVVSMDGFDAASYKEARGIDGFDLVWSNVRHFKSSSPSTSVAIRIVLSRINLFHLPEIFEQARQNHVDRVGLSPLDVDSESFSRKGVDASKVQQLTNRFLPSEAELQQFLVQLDGELGMSIEKAHAQGLSDWSADEYRRCALFYLDVRLGRSMRQGAEPCLFPLTSMVLDYDGGLKPCFYGAAITTLDEPHAYESGLTQALESFRKSGKCGRCRGKVFCDVARF